MQPRRQIEYKLITECPGEPRLAHNLKPCFWILTFTQTLQYNIACTAIVSFVRRIPVSNEMLVAFYVS
jgi:hypothetical protein